MITPGHLLADFQSLGILSGDTVMLHSSYKSIIGKDDFVLGGPNSVIQALLDVLTPSGTLMMYVGWQEFPYDLSDLPEDIQQQYYAEHPPFELASARAKREHGILAEVLRTWPGARRSQHPEASMSAVGGGAEWMTKDHPMRYGYGPGSPLAKLCEAGGKVLLLGAPVNATTLLHHAEHLADLPDKRIFRYRCPVVQDGRTVWLDMEDYETGDKVIVANYTFSEIMGHYLRTGVVKSGMVAHAQSYLFDAPSLIKFTVEWLESRYGFSQKSSEHID